MEREKNVGMGRRARVRCEWGFGGYAANADRLSELDLAPSIGLRALIGAGADVFPCLKAVIDDTVA